MKLALSITLSLLISSSLYAEDFVVCPAVMPQAAGLTSNGELGISFASENPVASFSDIASIETGDQCFGNFVIDSMLNACAKFTAEHALKSEVVSCSNQDSEIAKLKRANRRLKNRIRNLR